MTADRTTLSARIAKLSDEQKDDILADLFACLDDGRLVDFYDGWEKTRKGNFRSAGNYPVEAPSWFSLGAAGYEATR